MTVDPDRGVEVVLPRRSSERQAERVVAELGPWIERRLAAQARAREAVAVPPGTVPYLGGALTLVPEPGRTRVHRRGDALLVPAADPRPALERWYRRAARAEIAPRAETAARGVGGRMTALTIRAQKTRWGSCSPSGALSFNWRLLLAPEPVLDYVVIHEACHLVVPDHSRRFWSLVERHCPEWRVHARWLRRYGSALVCSESGRQRRRTSTAAMKEAGRTAAATPRATRVELSAQGAPKSTLDGRLSD